jgi:acetyltransferase
VSEVAEGEADLVFVCTPNKVNVDLLRACAAKGVRAAFVTSAGYAEAGPEGIALQEELVKTADELGILLIGPNGQGVISTRFRCVRRSSHRFPPPAGFPSRARAEIWFRRFSTMRVVRGSG